MIATENRVPTDRIRYMRGEGPIGVKFVVCFGSCERRRTNSVALATISPVDSVE
jgi:hypothetical protein